MICVVVPVHNEEATLARCLASIQQAAADPLLCCEPVLIVAVLDACTDGSELIARESGALTLKTTARCVGEARALGGEYAVNCGARWMACTDADSEVPADWLSRQLGHAADAICGPVQVGDWSALGGAMKARFERLYGQHENHRHIHGANLGVAASAYRAVGGFQALGTGEDVALIDAMRHRGMQVKWVSDPCVITSARLEARAPEGFAAYLLTLKSNAAAER